MQRMQNAERAAVRLGIPALLVASCTAAIVVSLHTAKSAIPNVAFGSHAVLAVQVAEFRERVMGRIERIIAASRF